MRMNSGGSVVQKLHCVSISIRSCRTRCGVWSQGASGAAAAENERRKKNASIDSIVMEARSVRDPADACANCRGSGEGWWRWWCKKKKHYRGPFSASLSTALHQKIAGTLSRGNKSRFPSEFLSEKRHCVERRGGLMEGTAWSLIHVNCTLGSAETCAPLLLIAAFFFLSFLEKKKR